MIMVGNQRGGARDLAQHLLKPENERITVHQIRGFVADDLRGAFQESHAISRATRCRQHLYSLSLNPPQDVETTPALFEDTVDRAEERLGLSGQPRVIVFHDKRGADGEMRRHAHAVWCRIDTDNMRAVQLSFTKTKLQGLSRELYREHGWTMPRGFVRHAEQSTTYSLAEWQQAKRAGRDPVKLKETIQDCWTISDSKAGFANALQEHGFILARGDKRGAVAVDHTGEAFPIARAMGLKAKQVRERLGTLEALPSRAEAHEQATEQMAAHLSALKLAEQRHAETERNRLTAERQRQETRHREQQAYQAEALAERQAREHAAREARLRGGWRGLLDRLSGRRKRTLEENHTALTLSRQRDDEAKAQLATKQAQERASLADKAAALARQQRERTRAITSDIAQLRPDAPRHDPTLSEREAFKAKRRTATAERPRRRGRSRDGPNPPPRGPSLSR